MSPAELAAHDQDVAQANDDARHTASGLGRLLVLLAGLVFVGLGILIPFHTPPLSGGTIAGAALIVLGATATYAALKE